MSDNKETFISLLEKYENNVVVPIIQRGYAQGRKTNEVNKIREDFLDVIIYFLSNDKEELILDYIYGVEDNGVFYLLDGQQRLTTLFLFHWYFNFNDEILKRFTYETRNSSKNFISFLLSIKREKIDLQTDEKLSKILKDNINFLNFWEKDTTVKGMLQVIDDIHKKVKNNKDIDSGKLNSIQFYCEYIKGDPDDLYIKMNSRGKQLTDFEIFKSKFEKFLDENNIIIKDKNYQGFDKKIDIDWTNFIWDFIKESNNNKDEGNELDGLFMKLFSFIFEMLYYSQIEIVEDTRKLQIEKSNLDFFELFFSHKGDKEKKEYINKLKANPIENELNKKIALKNNIEFIINIFDILSSLGKNNLNELFNRIFYYNNESKNDEDKYNKICTFNNNLNVFNNNDNLFDFLRNIEKRILIFSVFKILNYEYLKNKENIKDIDNIKNKYFNKLRLIRNLLYNTDNLYGNIYYQMKLIDKIITEDEITVMENQLSDKEKRIKNILFTDKLVESEKNKLTILENTDENTRKRIYACENNVFLQGNINFILDYLVSSECNDNIVGIINHIFIEGGFNNYDWKFLIHRAMLSFIDIEKIMKGCKEYEYKYHIYTEYIFKNYKLWDNRKNDKERFINFVKSISKKINDKNIEDSIKENCKNIIYNTENYIKKDENDFRYLLIKDATYGNDNITNLFHYISGTIKWKGNRGYYLYLNKTKQNILDIPLSTKVHTMFDKFLQKHTDFKLYYFDGSNNPNIEESRILKYSNNEEVLYCYEWITLAKEIEIADEIVLVGFTTDGYCIECGIRKYDFNVSETKINEINKKINNDILCKLNQNLYSDNSGAYYYWKYLDPCDDKILEKEYEKILKPVIDAFLQNK